LPHHGVDPRAPLAGGDALDARDELEVLAHGHVRVERRGFRQVARAPLRLDRVRENVVAGDGCVALGRRHVAGQYPHGRGLAGPVRAEEPEDFSSFDAEAHIVHGGDAAVALGEVLDLDHVKSP
jgi:hypothetical protein